MAPARRLPGGETAVYFSAGTVALEQARAICAGCSVREQCLEVALEDRELLGVWAGTTEAERREIRKGRVA